MNKYLKISILISGLALLLTACGGGGGTTINVTLTDFSYTPNTFTVPAGATVTVNARNNGAIEHEFVIMKLGNTVTAPFGDKDESNIFWELDSIEAGTSKSGTFTAPTEPGQYEVVCGLAGHIEAGMTASLTVK